MTEKAEIQAAHGVPPTALSPTHKGEKNVGHVEIEEHVHKEHVEEISAELEALLHTDPLKRLTDDEVARRRETFGRSELVEKKRHPVLKFLSYFTGAIAYLIEISVICAAVVGVNKTDEEITEHCIRADGFAQVIPEHKCRAVELLQNRGILVDMTGDGVNDAPALKKANVGIAVHGCTDAARSAADIVLLASGLSTIVDGLMTSRAIFQRMRSYALYRITSTVHFLMFFFCVTMAFGWKMKPILLILICILNDAATLVISVDNAKISAHPDKWRIGQLIFLSVVLGTLLTGLSFTHFFIARDVIVVSKEQLEAIMYLHISSAPHFVIFSTRLSGYFWENMPSPIFFVAVMGTQVFAMLICVYGVYIFKRWSFEFTAHAWPTKARGEKLATRKARAIQQQHVWASIDKVRQVGLKIKVLEALKA
ncbi:MAG: hypothetical protein J3Q66DRAFT_409586 [Benniella sp.]|nr:MAG: hypothetical protein J3Q66DRAFT_409586 [Benniella sp.]